MIVKNVPGRATWGHIALLAGFAAFIVWYVADSFLASSQITNLLLIVPVGGYSTTSRAQASHSGFAPGILSSKALSFASAPCSFSLFEPPDQLL